MCRICRETAFLNNKQRGVLQLKQVENELVINDERFHPRLRIKKKKSNAFFESVKIWHFHYKLFFFSSSSQKQFYLLSLPAKAELTETETEDPLKWITPTHTRAHAQRRLFKYFDFAARNCVFFLIHPRWPVVFVKPISWVNWELKRCLLTWRYESVSAAVQSCRRTIRVLIPFHIFPLLWMTHRGSHHLLCRVVQLDALWRASFASLSLSLHIFFF